MKKKPIAAFIFDTHLGENNSSVVSSVFDQAFEIVKSLGLNRLQHGGDIFHSRKAQTQANLVFLKSIYNKANEQGIIIDEIIGNHDKTSYDSADSFIDPYEHHPGVNIIRIADVGKLTKDIAIHYLSFFSDEQYIQYLLQLDKNPIWKQAKKHVMLTHIGVAGAMMNNGIRIKSRITADLFKRYDTVLIGHYHDPQEFDNIVYAGASVQHNFGEQTGKGLTVLYYDISRALIPLKYPQYLKYEVDPRELNDTDISEIKKEKEESGDHIRIELVGPEAVVKAFDKKLLEAGGVEVKMKEDLISIEDIEARAEPFNVNTIFHEFTEFCITNTLLEKEGLHYLEPVLQI